MTVVIFFNDTATTEIYTLSLHDALPILSVSVSSNLERPAPFSLDAGFFPVRLPWVLSLMSWVEGQVGGPSPEKVLDRKSTRLNSSHANISYAVFCLNKKNA